MFALSRGELAIVVFIFALVWVAGALPVAASRWSERLASRRARRVPRGD